MGRTSSIASDSPSLEDFESASASVLRKWGMLKETEEEQAAVSDEEDAELVSVLDSAADLRAEPADSKLSQLEPISDTAPEPCMPSPAKSAAAVAPPPTPANPPSQKKKGFAWMCCRASPTKPEADEAVPAAAEAEAGPREEKLPNGDSYRGQHEGGVRQGMAVYRFADGDAFEGEFAQNCMHGAGVYSFANEGRYAGQVKCDRVLCTSGLSHCLQHQSRIVIVTCAVASQHTNALAGVQLNRFCYGVLRMLPSMHPTHSSLTFDGNILQACTL